ncbi:integrase catalytic domain-containing protein [Trichonephila clavipes]|nr:integrase catalytic domain-containing protein [Trichonephila clavipes]
MKKSLRDPKVGEIVLIGDDNKKRLFWPMARIIELIPGRDGKIRTVKLKTQHGTVLRPVQHVYPLEIRANENCVTEEVAATRNEVTTTTVINTTMEDCSRTHETTPQVKGDIEDVYIQLQKVAHLG